MTDTCILLVFWGLAFVVASSVLMTHFVSKRKHTKKVRKSIHPGVEVRIYTCINDEFDDYKLSYTYTVTECREEYFKYRKENSTGYCAFDEFGKYCDLAEVYDGGKLVLRTGYKDWFNLS